MLLIMNIYQFIKSIIVATIFATSWVAATAQTIEPQKTLVPANSNGSTATAIKEMLAEFDSKQIAETTIDEEQGLVTLTTIYGETIKLNARERRTKPLVICEEMPEFPGGNNEMLRFISNNLKWPIEYFESDVYGRSHFSIVIDETGKVTNVFTRRVFIKEFDREAAKVILSMPKWKPGKQNGKAIPVQLNMPIDWRIN